MGLKSDGSIVAWGNNTYGQLQVPEGNNFVAVACGFWCSRALKSDGSGVVWGWNQYPPAPASNEEFAAIADGGFHSVGLKFDGSLSAWGLNNCRQCDVPPGNGFITVARGDYHSLALVTDDDSVVQASLNSSQQLDIPAGADVVAVARGVYHGVSAIGEPVVLILLGLVAIILYATGRGWPSGSHKNGKIRGARVPTRFATRRVKSALVTATADKVVNKSKSSYGSALNENKSI
jgi:alpha-tubulin suppressor-like RCC1 family protein